jgi:hypothetical protein
MRSKKLVVVVHGIGDAKETFYRSWESTLHANHGDGRFDVTGLCWEPALDKVKERYPLIRVDLARVLAAYELPQLKAIVEGSTYKKLEDHVMDVIGYVGLPDMSAYLRDWCLNKLFSIIGDRQRDVVIVAHSLGAAMIPHILWYDRLKTGAIPYVGVILLASPLGIRSPVRGVPDPLTLLANETLLIRAKKMSRNETLRNFAKMWTRKGDRRLTFVINKNDIVCSDVAYTIGGRKVDLIPVQQGLSVEEKRILEETHPGSIKEFIAGEPKPGKINENHDIHMYLNRSEFKEAFEYLLNVDV